MMWALKDLARFESERDAMSALSSEADWLTVIRWHVSDGLCLCVDADLQIGNAVRKVTLKYPEMFPHAPPSVLPRESEGRWSSHQYGPMGELCLSYRPDNWLSTVTGADMLASAYELLSTESGTSAQGSRGNVVLSAHRTTLGQRIRNETWRFMVTIATQDALRALSSIEVGTARLRSTGGTIVGWLTTVGVDAAPISEASFPTEVLPTPPEMPATIVPVEDAGPKLVDALCNDARTLRALLLGDRAPEDEPKEEVLVLVTPTHIRAIYLWLEDGHNSAWELAVLSASDAQRRQDTEAGALAEQKVALIGCGSLGSKVAAMLARAGIRSFILIDDDVFLPENLVRHELTWESVGAHKVDALARHLKLLGATDVTVRRQQLGGQESSGTLANVLKVLGQSTLIVDASANDLAFGYVAAVAKQTQKPVVWGKIFGGGFGGEIARVRPGIEPAADVARYRISQWCDARDVAPPVSVANRYESGDAEAPMIAYDADVTAIAAQVARMAIDTALARVPSAFESSAYLIGLRKEWIFTAAFDTWPIDLGEPVRHVEQGPLTDEQRREAAAELAEIIKLSYGLS
jgi:molybdopterin/thiamine biosynthesis adenylyltransferase/ubiquitin-protein ligase